MKKFLTTLMMCALVSCAPAPIPSTSGLASVKIPQTAVKNQQDAGFCWSYSLMGLIESETLVKTGRTLDLSEEYIAFLRMTAELAADLRSKKPMNDIKQTILEGGYEGWLTRAPARWDDELTDGMELVDLFGVLEESEWSIKFKNISFPFVGAGNSYKEELARLVDNLDDKSTDDEIMAAVAQSWGKSVPPKGHQISIKARDYENVWVDDYSGLSPLIMRMKRVLAAGYAVEMGFGVSWNKLNSKGVFIGLSDMTPEDYAKMSKSQARREFASAGGHSVLITDFVNIGGMPGRISSTALQAEVAKEFTQLDYVIHKGSWGMTGVGSTGYYHNELGNLMGNAVSGTLDMTFPVGVK